MLTMQATTPSKATITPTGTQSAAGPLVYALGADAITSILFSNVYLGSHTTISLSSAPPAATIVSIDGSTGTVDFVAPGVFKKGPGGTYIGKFSAIYDRTGKNIALAGASSIEVNSTTGKLTSFR